LNPITTDLLLGFENNNIRTISVAKGDTERKVHCELHDSIISYMIEDTTYIFLRGIYSNGEIIVPIRLWTNYEDMQHESELSPDGTEFDFYIPKSALQISGVAKCTLTFIKSNDVPVFDIHGNLLSDDSEVLTTEKFNLYIEGDVYEDGCYSATDEVQVSALLPLVVAVQSVVDGEEERIANENERKANEIIRQDNETTRSSNESDRVNAESSRVNAEDVRIANESTRVSNENTRQSNENIREEQEARRESDTATAVNRANAISETLEEKLAHGDFAFKIVKVYPSVQAMNDDYGGTDVNQGEFVIVTTNVEDPDNATLYIKGSQKYDFITDMSGATGLAATIRVGTVTTVDSYESASVINVGDEYNAVFDIAIPRGHDGNAGDLPDIQNKVAGVIIPDGSTITMEEDGTIHSLAGGDSALYIDSSDYLSIDYSLIRHG